MRRFLIALFVLSALNASAQGFIDFQAKLAKQKYEQQVAKAHARGAAANVSDRMKLFVTISADADARDVANAAQAIGAKVRVVKGNFMALDIPYSQLEALANVEGVEIVNMPPKTVMRTDVTRTATHAVEVNDGSAPLLPQAYTGKGVIVGVIDAGFDISHPMFKDKDGNLRIKGLYKPGNTTFGGDSVVVYADDGTTTTLSGSAYSKPEDLLDTLKVKDVDGSHGSHCVSVAAGSVMNDVKGTSGQSLGGIAPEADILLCNIYDSENNGSAWDMVESAYYMANEAKKTNQPLVISLSSNTQMGWHDGTSDFSRYLGMLCKDNKLNIMLCTSNEGGYQTYLHETMPAKDTLQLTAFSTKSDGYIWGGMKTTRNVRMIIGIVNLTEDKEYYRMPFTFVSNGLEDGQGILFDFADDEQQLTNKEKNAKAELMKYIKGGQIQMWCYQGSALNKEGKSYIFTQIYLASRDIEWINKEDADGKPQQWGFNAYLVPNETTELYAWGDVGYNLQAVTPDGTHVIGTSDCSIGDFNTSGYPVSIGAWVANDKMKYEGMPVTGTDFSMGDIAFFSSYGTDLAGHKHPDVCAPGTCIVAAFNSFDPTLDQMPVYLHKGYDNQFIGQSERRDYFYGTGSGTSMSTPAAAGVVALWLQAANDKGKTLTCDDIKDIIAHTSDTDEFTEASPERFGCGKINAYKGLLYVLDMETSIPTLSKEQPRGVTFRVTGDQVYADGAEDGTPATIYNLQGAKVRETAVQGGALSTTGLPRGVYAIQLGKLGSTLIRK